MQRVRLIRKLSPMLNGVDLSHVKVGDEFIVAEAVATMLLTEGWAVLATPATTTVTSRPPVTDRRVDDRDAMIWFFERHGVRLQCEIRRTSDGQAFELAWTTPKGEPHLERSSDPDILDARRRELQLKLEKDGWTRVGRDTPPKRFL